MLRIMEGLLEYLGVARRVLALKGYCTVDPGGIVLRISEGRCILESSITCVC